MVKMISYLQVGAALLEIIGVVLMANGLFPIKKTHLFIVIISAIFRGNIAKGTAVTSTLNNENRIATLQGLSFICLGFFVQAVSLILGLFFAP